MISNYLTGLFSSKPKQLSPQSDHDVTDFLLGDSKSVLEYRLEEDPYFLTTTEQFTPSHQTHADGFEDSFLLSDTTSYWEHQAELKKRA